MNVFKVVTKRQFWIIVATLMFIIGWMNWYYAVWLGSKLKDKVYISIFDVEPGVLITVSYIFILPWDGGHRTSVGSFSRPRRVGGPCSPSCLKLVMGSAFFVVGFLWGILGLALHRFFIIMPDDKSPQNIVPGILVLLHILFLTFTGISLVVYSELPDNGELMSCSGAEGDENGAGSGSIQLDEF
jgi:hypothetical protein